MTEYIRGEGLLPADEVERLISASPTGPLTQADVERLGFGIWEEWLESVCCWVLYGCEDGQLLLQIA